MTSQKFPFKWLAFGLVLYVAIAFFSGLIPKGDDRGFLLQLIERFLHLLNWLAPGYLVGRVIGKGGLRYGAAVGFAGFILCALVWGYPYFWVDPLISVGGQAWLIQPLLSALLGGLAGGVGELHALKRNHVQP